MIIPLDYPDGYFSMSPEKKAEVCNGAGAADGIKVPSTMYGLDLTEVFNIHDYDYYMGENEEDKRAADGRMLINSMRMINNYGGRLRKLRRYRATSYYTAVADYGKKAFYAGKEQSA
tara:strand:- start:21436 stop:21786 length:351 start_codon:yes stop_codon:yes gene_type:complete